MFSTCIYHAYLNGNSFSFLLTGVLYGLVIENLAISIFEIYSYNMEYFSFPVGEVPISIGLIWAVLIYTGLNIGRNLEASGISLPLFAGVFGLKKDLAIEWVAISIPLWNWYWDVLWFNVAPGNFLAWLITPFFFTFFWIFLKSKGVENTALCVLTLFTSTILVTIILKVWTYVFRTLDLVTIELSVLILIFTFSVWLVKSSVELDRNIDTKLVFIVFMIYISFIAHYFLNNLHTTDTYTIIPVLTGLNVALILYKWSEIQRHFI